MGNSTSSEVSSVSEVSEVKRGRGRPPVYTAEQRATIADLIAKNNASEARRILRAKNGIVGVSKVDRLRADLRKSLGFEKPLTISLPTLNGIAEEFGVAKERGRPALAQAA